MKIFSYKNDPLYPDRYTPDTNWVKILPHPGRPLQSAEIIEIQSIAQNNIKQLAEGIYGNGGIIKGLNISIIGKTKNELSIQISDGLINVEGVALSIKGAIFNIPLYSITQIGVSVEESIITESDDINLRSPLLGGELYGHPGAARLVWEGKLTLNNRHSYPIAIIEYGRIKPIGNSDDEIIDVMARYTYDRVGNFRVHGLDVTYTNININEGNDYLDLISDRDTITNELSIAGKTLYELRVELSHTTNLDDRAIVQQEIDQQLSNIYKLEERLSNTSQLLSTIIPYQGISTYELNVSPGIAYINGYRVEKLINDSIYIPKELPTIKVESSKYIYRNDIPSITRHLSYGTAHNINEVKNAVTSIRIVINDIPYGDTLIPIRISMVIDPNLEDVLVIDDILPNLVNALSTTSDIPSHLHLSSNMGSDINPLVLRDLIQEYITISTIDNLDLVVGLKTSTPLSISVSISNPTLSIDTTLTNLIPINNTEHQLSNRVIASIDKVVIELKEQDIPLIRGTDISGKDKLPISNIFTINSVRQGDQIFTEGLDYQLVNNDTISWEAPGIEPEPGTTYLISYTYTKVLPSTDYSLNPSNNTLVFLGETPTPFHYFYVDYQYALVRGGAILMDRYGVITYTLSAPSIDPIFPPIPNDQLLLTKLVLSSKGIELISYYNKVWDIPKINDLLEQVRSNTFNLELLRLELTQAPTIIDNEEPINIFHDGLLDLSNIDTNASSFTLLPTIMGITVPSLAKDIDLKYNGGGILIQELGKPSLIMLGGQSLKIKDQDRATRLREVIPKLISTSMKVLPRDIFIRDHNTYSPIISPIDHITPNIDRTKDSPYLFTLRNIGEATYNDAIDRIKDNLAHGLSTGSALITKVNSFLTPLTQPILINNIDIHLRVDGLPSNKSGYRLYIDGKETFNIIPLGTTIIDNKGIKAGNNESIDLKLSLPSNIGIGPHLLELVDPYQLVVGQAIINIHDTLQLSLVYTWDYLWGKDYSPASVNHISPYSHKGTSKLGIVRTNQYEYLMQEFTIDYPLVLQSINLRLSNLKGESHPYLVIREVEENGIPSMTILSKAYPINLYSTNNSSMGSTFHLITPLLLDPNKKYVFGINTRGNSIGVYTAVIGEPDLLGGQTIGNQIRFNTNKLWLSIDGSNLSQLENESISYELNRIQFNTNLSTIISLGNYGLIDNMVRSTHFTLNTKDIRPYGTNLTYQYTNNDGESWHSIEPNTGIALPNTSETIGIRAIMRSDHPALSPIISLNGTSITLHTYMDKGVIYSNLYEVDRPYTKVRIVIHHTDLTNSYIQCYQSSDRVNWELMELIEEPVIEDAILTLYKSTYSIDLYSNNSRTKFWYRIDLSTKRYNTKPPIITGVSTYVY